MSLTNTQYDTIMRTYQERQAARQRLIASRKEEVAGRSPQFAALDGEMAQISVQKARLLLAGSDSALSELKVQLAGVAQKRKVLLADMGLSEDYFNPPYVCEKCKDTGYVDQERCSCFKQAAIDLIYAQANLEHVLESENFDTFSLQYYAKDLMSKDGTVSSYAAAKHAYDSCRQFVDRFDDQNQNLLLFGDTGVGKSFLSHCVAKSLLDNGHSVIYFSAQQFFDALAKKTFEHDAQAEADYQSILDCDLLILDDLGTEMSNSFTTSQFFVVLNERLRNRKAILISSNLELYDIATIYSERVFSRITDSFQLLRLFGKDIRIQKKLANR